MKNQSNKKLRSSSFTLIEVVIVIVILVTLASIATPMYLNYVKSANIGAAKSQIKLLVDAVNGYKLAYKNYPEGENGLQALVENIEDKENWQPSLQGSLPKDPWGNDYIYKCPGEENRPFEIISYGADGEPGGEDENADINSWD